MPAVIDTCLVGRRRARLPGPAAYRHAERVAASSKTRWRRSSGRTIHMYHTEGAGGGHAPDIIRVAGEMNCLPSSTNPTNPYTVNTFDEHLDMTMVCHHLNPAIPEDVAFAESRIRAQTIAAEDVLHDIGAISMLGSDSQGMGRINEVICRTWQLASQDEGPARPPAGRENASVGDNERIKRYIAKYTINAARTFGIDEYIGSLEPGKLADIVLWRPGFFGIKPELVVKGGFIAWGAMGDSAASLMTCEPLLMRPQWGAFGARQAGLERVLRQSARDRRRTSPGKLGLTKALLPTQRHAQAQQAAHAAQRRLPEDHGQPADLRRLRRRRARHLRAGRRVCRSPAVHAAMTMGSRSPRPARLPRAPRALGIGGPVGSGKTALVERLIPAFNGRGTSRSRSSPTISSPRKTRSASGARGLIDPARVLAVETGACPHTAIREDPTLNIQAVDELDRKLSGARPHADRIGRRQSRLDLLARPRRLLDVRHRRRRRRRHSAQARARHRALATCWSSTRPTSRPMSASTSTGWCERPTRCAAAAR